MIMYKTSSQFSTNKNLSNIWYIVTIREKNIYSSKMYLKVCNLNKVNAEIMMQIS